jgi:hypothetical protein
MMIDEQLSPHLKMGAMETFRADVAHFIYPPFKNGGYGNI